jgi:hypothetical protein
VTCSTVGEGNRHYIDVKIFSDWAIYKYADYLTHKLTASACSNRYCNWTVVFMKLTMSNCGGGRTNDLLITN